MPGVRRSLKQTVAERRHIVLAEALEVKPPT
jgi:hypothetical protein